jgi:membrane protein DedA with SNARE-associated domain
MSASGRGRAKERAGAACWSFFTGFANDARWSRLRQTILLSLAFIAFSESFVGISFIVPGTFLLIALGGVIGATHISLFPAWLGAVLGSILGDWISWWIGFHYHRSIVHSRVFRRFEESIEKALQLFHRWGSCATFIGHFLGPLRAHVRSKAGRTKVVY